LFVAIRSSTFPKNFRVLCKHSQQSWLIPSYCGKINTASTQTITQFFFIFPFFLFLFLLPLLLPLRQALAEKKAPLFFFSSLSGNFALVLTPQPSHPFERLAFFSPPPFFILFHFIPSANPTSLSRRRFNRENSSSPPESNLFFLLFQREILKKPLRASSSF